MHNHPVFGIIGLSEDRKNFPTVVGVYVYSTPQFEARTDDKDTLIRNYIDGANAAYAARSVSAQKLCGGINKY